MTNVRYLTPEDHNRAVRVAPLDSIIAEVSALTGVHERLIRGRSRERTVVKARWLAWSVAHREGMSFAEIGRPHGLRPYQCPSTASAARKLCGGTHELAHQRHHLPVAESRGAGARRDAVGHQQRGEARPSRPRRQEPGAAWQHERTCQGRDAVRREVPIAEGSFRATRHQPSASMPASRKEHPEGHKAPVASGG